MTMRQILYKSLSTIAGDEADITRIINQSRHNNAIDGVTGLLWFDGAHFLQLFEGPPESVDATLARIRADPRHRDIEIHLDRTVERRAFAMWNMGYGNPRDPVLAPDAAMRRLLSRADPDVARPFLSLIA